MNKEDIVKELKALIIKAAILRQDLAMYEKKIETLERLLKNKNTEVKKE